ncbi:MAG: AAA family ATPase [Gammaproteobacteria bacterium]|nr:AAA family ATPase [Gammaproteobacteria bacterium]
MDSKMTAGEAADFLGVTVQAIHKQLKSRTLKFKKNQNRVYFSHETSRELFRIRFKQKMLAFQIVKGGTGKTSLVYSIAVRANLYGARVLCIDLDQQGNLTQAFKINPEEMPAMIDVLRGGVPVEQAIVNVGEGLDLIPSRIENAVLDNAIILGKHSLAHVYKKMLDPLRSNYDLIIIDCPPALGQSVAAMALAVDEVVSPVTPEKFCLSGLKITTQELNGLEENANHKVAMRIVVNKFDSRTSLSHEVLSTLIKHPIYGEKLYKTYVRTNQEFPNAIARGQSVFDTLKMSTAKEDIDLLTRELLEITAPSEIKNSISLGKLEEIEIESAVA